MIESPLQVRQRDTLTLPANLRAKYGIKEGDTLYLLDLDGIFVLTPMVPLIPELAREIERLRLEAGLSTEELWPACVSSANAISAECKPRGARTRPRSP